LDFRNKFQYEKFGRHRKLIAENRICIVLHIKKLFYKSFYCIIPTLVSGNNDFVRHFDNHEGNIKLFLFFRFNA